MTHTTTWHIQKRVALITPEGDLDLKAMYAMSEDANRLLDSGRPPVHIVFDLRAVGECEAQIMPIRNMGQYLARPEMGTLVTIGGNPITRFIVMVMQHLTRIQVLKADDIDEALRQLQAVDETLTNCCS